MRSVLILISLLLGTSARLMAMAPPAAPAPISPQHIEFFEAKVRPLLIQHCIQCHGEKVQKGGLRLDTAAGVRHGIDSTPIVLPGNSNKSLMLAAVNRTGEYPMPPKTALSEDSIAVLTEWVKIGAPFPETNDRIVKGSDPRKHWAFQPVKPPLIPKSSAASDIDRLIRTRLTEKGLIPADPADRATLIRRAYFDLIGLPPTAEESEAFVKDPSPDAFAAIIDRLLASPHYGERWGRYWLDVARYADTKGYVFQEERNFPYSYVYRDYVIQSFNDDKPYDRFLIEQIAADKLPPSPDNRALAGMGFLTVGRRFMNNTHDLIDDRIDVITRGTMGLTVTCARCHDHKYDPIPTRDYYSLYGVLLASEEPQELPLLTGFKRTPEVEAYEKELHQKTVNVQAVVVSLHAQEVAKLRTAESVSAYLLAYTKTRGISQEQVRAYVKDHDLNRYAFDRWQAALDAELKDHSSVFSPLIALSLTSDANYPARLAELLADVKKPINPLVRKSLTDPKVKNFTSAIQVLAQVMTQPVPKEPSRDYAELSKLLGLGGPTDIPVSAAINLQNRADQDQLAKLRRNVEAFKVNSPHAPPRAMVMNDRKTPFEPYVFVRGNPSNHGPIVPRQAPEIVSGANRKPFADGSGRLEFARAIASRDNPLTARVMVNRVWLGHFGQGLVRTPSDFGLRSDPPALPELLDYLAFRFAEDGWSIKKLHRLIMLSEAYRQASTPTPAQYAADPENRYLSYQNRRRLDFEALRDSTLAVAGKLDRKVGGKPVDLFKAPFSARRTVYGYIDRQNLPGTLRIFDFASPDQHSPQRFQTTVPQQALFLMNSPFIAEESRGLTSIDAIKNARTTAERIANLYRAVYSRNPTSEEQIAGRDFLNGVDYKADSSQSYGKWSQYAQVLLLANEFAFVD